METRICKYCLEEKSVNMMVIHSINKIGLKIYRSMCIECGPKRKYSKSYYQKNKERNNEISRMWTLNNKERKKELNKRRNDPEKKLKYSIAKKLWRENNKDKENEYEKSRYLRRTDLQKLKNNLRNSIRLYLLNKGFKKLSKTEEILGCSFEEFKSHIESKFEPWMNWENWGKYNGEFQYGWDIDHIIPLSSSKSEADIIELCHYTNLNPLCSKVNRHIKRGNLFQS